MADTQVSALAALTGANTASGDLFHIVDVSDTTMAASGTNKKITRTELRNAVSIAGKIPTGQYIPPPGTNTLATVVPTNGKLIANAVAVHQTQTFDRIYIEVVTAQTGALVRLGIYADNGNREPDSLVVDGGTVDASTTGGKTVTISQSLDPGIYWLVSCSQASGSVATVRTASSLTKLWLFGDPGNYSFSVQECLQSSSSAYTSGALPSTFGAYGGAGGNSSTGVFMRGA